MRRAREVRVVAERPESRRRARALEPRRLVVLARFRVGRPDQRRDGIPPGGRCCSAASASHTRSSSGRSTWQETTAYRSVTVGGIAQRIPRSAVLLVITAAALPRLAVLAVERNDVLTRYVEKSDTFARTLVSSGTFGFLPGVPSAYTQPLYAWFLAALYWPLERTWLVVGLAQIAVAVATALVVLAIGTRLSSVTTGVIAALVATLHPYLVWHDVHVNREILDGFLLALLVLFALVAYERASPAYAAATGAVAGLAILSNARLLLLPLVLVPYVAWRAVGRRVLARGARGRRRRRRRGAVGRPEPGRDRLRDDHDRQPGALEGEQPRDPRGPRPRRVDRRRARPPERPALAGEGGRDLGGGREGGRRVCAVAVLPRPGLRLLARPPRRKGAARGAGGRDALVAVLERDGGRGRPAGRLRPRPAHRRAGLRALRSTRSRCGAHSSRHAGSSRSQRSSSPSTR